MKVIIPMAGRAKRFNDFLSTKPLIEIDGKPMIEHAVECFPRSTSFVFLCQRTHLESTPMREVLERIAPESVIIPVENEMLKGPAYTALASFPYVEDDEPVIVNYADFIQVWDYQGFLRKLDSERPDGAIVTFRGFHPASLGDTYYAYVQTDPQGRVLAIREKTSFTPDRMQELASTGTYYFATGKLFKEYVERLVRDEHHAVNGEFYMSLPFALMVQDSLKVMTYEAEKFICLGTPRDYEIYKFWSEFFEQYAPRFITFDNINLKVTNVFPLAGGERDFRSLGYDIPNFLVPVMNRTLIEHSFKSNPRGVRNLFIGLRKEEEHFRTLELFRQYGSEVVLLDEEKRGNAATIYEIRSRVDAEKPLCVCGSTYILAYNERKVANLMEREDIDVVLFSFSHHECVLRAPENFAYALLKDNIEVENITERKTISASPYKDHALTGTAIFKRADDLFEAIRMQTEKHPGEKLYYLTCLNNILSKRKVVIFEVDKFVPIRTPLNFREFGYWQEYFDQRGYHPYSRILQ